MHFSFSLKCNVWNTCEWEFSYINSPNSKSFGKILNKDNSYKSVNKNQNKMKFKEIAIQWIKWAKDKDRQFT